MNAEMIVGWELNDEQKRTMLTWLNFFCKIDPELIAAHTRMECTVAGGYDISDIDNYDDLERAELYCGIIDNTWKTLSNVDVGLRIATTKHIAEFFDEDGDIQTIMTVGRVFVELHTLATKTDIEDLQFWLGFARRWKEEKRELVKNLTTIELIGEPMAYIASDTTDHAERG